jgi:hypothetical protein
MEASLTAQGRRDEVEETATQIKWEYNKLLYN